MLSYIRDHWRGEQSLVRSYWFNGMVLSGIIGLGLSGAVFLISPYLQSVSVMLPLMVHAAVSFFMLAFVVWLLVGIWRSARRNARSKNGSFWPGMAQFSVVLNFIVIMAALGVTGNEVARVMVALNDPMLSSYDIQRRGDTLALHGAINGRSVSEVMNQFSDPSLLNLEINSGGGIVAPAIRLARFVNEYGIPVMVDRQCISACVFILAASPEGAIRATSSVTFHRPEPVTTSFATSRFSSGMTRDVERVEDLFREFGIAEWAVRNASRQPLWTPTISQLVEMNMITSIHDPERQRLVAADRFCAYNQSWCAR